MQNENERILRPSILGVVGLLLGCSVFVAGGVLMANAGKMIGWIAICFFGVGVIVALIQLLPNASYLRLTEDGIEVRTMFRSWSASWNEIAFFATASLKHGGIAVHNMVVFNFSDQYDKSKLGRRIASSISGYEGALPDTYGMKADQLAALLSKWKERFDKTRRTP